MKSSRRCKKSHPSSAPRLLVCRFCCALLCCENDAFLLFSAGWHATLMHCRKASSRVSLIDLLSELLARSPTGGCVGVVISVGVVVVAVCLVMNGFSAAESGFDDLLRSSTACCSSQSQVGATARHDFQQARVHTSSAGFGEYRSSIGVLFYGCNPPSLATVRPFHK